MSADTLAGLQGTSEVQALEGGCSGATEGMEVVALSTLHSSFGYSDSLALSSSQRSLLTSICCCGTTTGIKQRLPCQAEVNHSVKHLLQYL